MSNVRVEASGGIGFGGFLLILFIGLKLTGYIAWSSWWVLSPLWIPFVAGFTITSVAFILALIVQDR